MPEIILNERQWAEDAIAKKSMGSKPSETIWRIARYYHSAGYKKKEIEGKLEDFLLMCDPSVNIVKWQGMIEYHARNASKYELIEIPEIRVTKREMESISSLNGVLLQRIMFTLLCLAKYGNKINPKNNGWVNRETREIFSMANVIVTVKRQSLLINDLWRAGMIGYSNIVDNVNVYVNIMDDDDTDVALTVSDFRNIGNQYMRYIGGEYIACENCGIVIKRTSPRQKYCKECAIDMNILNTIKNRKGGSAA